MAVGFAALECLCWVFFFVFFCLKKKKTVGARGGSVFFGRVGRWATEAHARTCICIGIGGITGVDGEVDWPAGIFSRIAI